MISRGDPRVSFQYLGPLPPRARPAPRIGRRARLIARLRVTALDRALIGGADPGRSAALTARAAMLTSTRFRECTAEGLERLVREAQRPRRRWWAIEHRQAILENAEELQALAEELHSERPLYAPGLARLNQFLVDGSGPAYRGRASALARALRDARAALDGAS